MGIEPTNADSHEAASTSEPRVSHVRRVSQPLPTAALLATALMTSAGAMALPMDATSTGARAEAARTQMDVWRRGEKQNVAAWIAKLGDAAKRFGENSRVSYGHGPQFALAVHAICGVNAHSLAFDGIVSDDDTSLPATPLQPHLLNLPPPAC